MKVAILSDIHSNLDALEAVLADIKTQGVDEIWNLGDIVGYGAYPKKCLDIAREQFKINIMGNHDGCSVSNEAKYRFPMNNFASEGIRYTVASLKSEDNEFLLNLPYYHINKDLGIVLSHGSFFQPEYWHYIQNKHDLLSEYLTLEKQVPEWKISFVGHSHMPFVYTKKNNKPVFPLIFGLVGDKFTLELEPEQKYIINVGSVGQPRDNNPKSCYCILDINDNNVNMSLLRVEYDTEKAYQAILDVGLSEILGNRLKLGK